MKKVLIVTHGKFAEGITSALNIILGDNSNIIYLNTYIDDSDFRDNLDILLNENINNELLIFTDLFGGSINQEVIKRLKKQSIDLISGVSLPLLLELLVTGIYWDKDKIRKAIDNAKNQIIYVNDYLETINKNGDDFE
ncbi:MAG: PTS sugar transporter subunit IIA [Erysipelotrichaceae bacterium]